MEVIFTINKKSKSLSTYFWDPEIIDEVIFGIYYLAFTIKYPFKAILHFTIKKNAFTLCMAETYE